MHMNKVRNLTAAIAFAAAMSVSAASHAGVMFTLGNHPETDEENILLGGIESGTMITGESNQNHIGVQFSSTHMLYQQGQGQAMIEATNQNPNRTDITNLTISAPGYRFHDLIFNMLNGSGTASLTATTGSGSYSFNMNLGNGQNFLTVLATGGDLMSSLTINATGFTQLKQPRISGPSAIESNPPPGTPVPEPSTLALLLVGMAGVAMRLRLKTRRAPRVATNAYR